MMPTSRPSESVAPESPRGQSPVPDGPQGDLELDLVGLASALYNLGTTVVSDSTKEKNKIGPSGEVLAAKPVGQKVNDVIRYLDQIERMSASVDTMIPMQVLQDIDSGRNPMVLTKDRLERAATENQFMNGKIHAIESYRALLDASLSEHFPELAPHLMAQHHTHGLPSPQFALDPDAKPDISGGDIVNK